MALSQRTQAKISRLRKEQTELDTAISGIQSGGQSYTVGDVTRQNSSVRTLLQRRQKVEKDIDRLLGARPVALGTNFGSMQR